LFKFKIEERILPWYYRGNVAFIIFDITHTIQKNQWRTKVRAYTVPLPITGEPTSNSQSKNQQNNKSSTTNKNAAPGTGIKIIKPYLY
jgi:hypothetical protein